MIYVLEDRFLKNYASPFFTIYFKLVKIKLNNINMDMHGR